MKKLLALTIPRNELKDYGDYVNYLFKTEGGRFNVPVDVEDIEKSNHWFKNFPLKTLVVSNYPIQIGDKFISECANQELNMKVFKYLGANKDGIDLIDIEDENGEKHISTKHLLTGAEKVEGEPTLEELKRVVNKQSLGIFLFDREWNEITDGCELSVQKLKEPVKVYSKEGTLYFSPYEKEEKVSDYFRQDILVFDY